MPFPVVPEKLRMTAKDRQPAISELTLAHTPARTHDVGKNQEVALFLYANREKFPFNFHLVLSRRSLHGLHPPPCVYVCFAGLSPGQRSSISRFQHSDPTFRFCSFLSLHFYFLFFFFVLCVIYLVHCSVFAAQLEHLQFPFISIGKSKYT